jgi:hypothetical protein
MPERYLNIQRFFVFFSFLPKETEFAMSHPLPIGGRL